MKPQKRISFLLLLGYNKPNPLISYSHLDRPSCAPLISFNTRSISSLTYQLKQAKLKGDFKAGEALWEAHTKSNAAPLDTYAFTTMISIYGRLGKLGKALEIFKNIPSPGTIPFNSILDCCYRLSAIDMAWSIFQDFKQNGISCDTTTKKILQNLFDKSDLQSQHRWREVKSYLHPLPLAARFLPLASFVDEEEEEVYITNGRGWDASLPQGLGDVRIVSKQDDIRLADQALALGIILQKHTSYRPQHSSFSRATNHFVHAECKAVSELLQRHPQRTDFKLQVNMTICDNCHWFFECLSLHKPSLTIYLSSGNTQHNFHNGKCSCGRICEQSESPVDLKKELISQTTNLKSLIQQNLWGKAEEQWLNMCASLPVDLKALNVMMQWFSKNLLLSNSERVQGMWALIDLMKGLGIRVDYGIWAALLQMYCKLDHLEEGDGVGVVKLWHELTSSGEVQHCNTPMFNMLIHLFGKVDPEKMWEVFYALESRCPPLTLTNHTVHSVLQNQKSVEGVNQVLGVMKKHGLDSNTVTFNILISLWGKLKGPDEAVDIWKDMIRRGVECNDRTWSSLFLVLTQSKRTDLLSSMISYIQSSHISPSIEGFNILIDFYGKHDLTKLHEIFTWMNNIHTILDIQMYVTLISAFGRSLQVDSVESLMLKAAKQWPNAVPPPISRVYAKSIHQMFMGSKTSAQKAHWGIGNASLLRTSMAWFLLHLPPQSTHSAHLPDPLNLSLFKISLQKIAEDINVDITSLPSPPPNLQASPRDILFSPFSYFFITQCPNPTPSVDQILDLLRHLHSSKPLQSPLMPSGLCILETSCGVFFGFTVAVPYKYRAELYQQIFHHLPPPLRQIIHEWVNPSPTSSPPPSSPIPSPFLGIKQLSTFSLNWAGPPSEFLIRRGMCLMCNKVFASLKDVASSPPSSSANYLLHCAEWEAIIRYCTI